MYVLGALIYSMQNVLWHQFKILSVDFVHPHCLRLIFDMVFYVLDKGLSFFCESTYAFLRI